MHPTPVVVHVPHSSVVVPDDVADAFLLAPAELARELLAMTDRYTDELFALSPDAATAVIYPVSRLVVDPERFADDDHEPMARKGMGVVYTRTSDGRPLRRPPTADERSRLLARFYDPHHTALTAAATAALEAHGSCLVLDAHSFPSRPLPYEEDQRAERPDICVGTDPHHTPSWLRDAAVAELERLGFRVAVDRPFSGALVPMAFYERDARVRGLMIEVNRGLYMDEESGARLPSFAETRAKLAIVLEHIIREHALRG